MKDFEDRLRALARDAENDLPSELRPRASDLRRIRTRRRLFGAGITSLAVLLIATAVMAGTRWAGDDRVPPVGDPTPAEREAQESDLWGQTFHSIAVTEDGEPRELLWRQPEPPEARIEVTFEGREDGTVLWEAGCNVQAAAVEITAERLLVSEEISTTDVGCDEVQHAQDDWLADFFRSDPNWELHGDRLTLTSGGTIIEFEAKDSVAAPALPSCDPEDRVEVTPALDDALEELYRAARERWPDSFAELWVDETADGFLQCVFIAYTEDAERRVEQLSEGFPEPDLIQPVTFERSIKELEARQREMGRDRERIRDGSLVVPGIPDRYNLGIDVMRNAIVVTVEDATAETIAAFKSRYGDDVIVEEGDIGGPH